MKQKLFSLLSAAMMLAGMVFSVISPAAAQSPESIYQENGSTVQKYFPAEAPEDLHTIYWAKGITPPKMSGTKGSNKRYGDFERIVDPGVDTQYITYQAPMETGKGYYDLNKQEKFLPDPRCYLASASNTLYWWMDQNSEYIDQYISQIGNRFNQSSGLVPLDDPDRWTQLRTAPSLVSDGQFLVQNLYDSYFMKSGGPFANNYGRYPSGYFMDLVFDFFINGFTAIKPHSDAPNTADMFQPDSAGGFFHPVFGKKPISRRISETDYDFYNHRFKEWILSGNGITLSFYTAKGAHAITVWGAEYDAQGNLCRLYITDSDDFSNGSVFTDHIRGIYSFDTRKDDAGVLRLGNATNFQKYPGVSISQVVLLNLAQDVWQAALNDPSPRPDVPVLTAQPTDQVYGKNATADPLSVTASIPEKDLKANAYLTYQWYQSPVPEGAGTPIPHANGSSFTPEIGSSAATVYYTCAVTSHKYGNESTAYTRWIKITTLDQQAVDAQLPQLTVNLNPHQPRYYSIGQTSDPLTVAASVTDGGTLTYQWYQTYTSEYHGSPIPGATEPVFMPPTGETARLFYYCEITNYNASATGSKIVRVKTPVQIVQVRKLEDQAPVAIGNVPASPSYGSSFTLSFQGGSGTGKVLWAITSGDDLAQIDPRTGAVTVTGVGTFQVTVTKSGDSTYAGRSASIVITSQPAVPQVGAVSLPGIYFTDITASQLEAKLICDHSSVPGTLTLQEGDFPLQEGTNTLHWIFTPEDSDHYASVSGTVSVEAKCRPEEQPEVKPEEKPEEKPEVKPEEKPDVKPEEKPDVKPEEKPEVKPEEKPEVKPEEKPDVKPEEKPEEKPEVKPEQTIVRKPFTQIPESLASTSFNTVNKIEDALQSQILKQMPGSQPVNTHLQDLVLYITENGVQRPARPEEIPQHVTVTLPYPEDTSPQTHHFAVAHMLTASVDGFNPGYIEFPAVTLTPEGIQVTLRSLSPVMIAWSEQVPTDSAPTTPPEQSETATPATGDSFTLIPALLLLTSGIGFYLAWFKRKSL